jgi:hypothetical protein
MNDEKKLQIMAELEQYVHEYPPMQEGDLTARDIAERYCLTERQALTWMERIVKENPEVWERAQVRGVNSRWRWVLRKVSI